MVELISKELTAGRNPLIEGREFIKDYEKFEGKSKILARACGVIEALLMEVTRRDNALENAEVVGIMPHSNAPNKALARYKADFEGLNPPKESEKEIESEPELSAQATLKKREGELNKIIAMERGAKKKLALKVKELEAKLKQNNEESQDNDAEMESKTQTE